MLVSSAGKCLDEPPGACKCDAGWTGAACEYDIATTNGLNPPGDGNHQAKMQGLIIGLTISLSVLLILCVLAYIKRTEVMEYVFWTLAATRFQRLHQEDQTPGGPGDSDTLSPGPPPLGPNPSWGFNAGPWGRGTRHDKDEEDEEIVLMTSRSSVPSATLRQGREQEEVEMTVM